MQQLKLVFKAFLNRYSYFPTDAKRIERKRVRNGVVSDSSESEDEGLMVKATEIETGDTKSERKKVRNRIVSDTSESEDEGKKILNMLNEKSF